MHTALSVTVSDSDADSVSKAAYLARGIVEKVQAAADSHDPNSEVSKLNKVAGTIRVPVSEHTFALLRLAREYHQKTGGALDITTSPLERHWGFDGSAVPEEPLSNDFLAAATRGVGMHFVRLHENQVVSYASPTTRICLDDLAAGYAVDLGVREIRNAGMPSALLNLGGKYVRCLGSLPEGRDWTLPIQNPLRLSEQVGTVHIRDGLAMASRRLLENFVVIAGQPYSRLLDPRTGRPAQGTAGVTVVGPTATEASALATALLVLGIDEASSALGSFPRCGVLIIPDREPLELWMNAAMQTKFEASPSLADRVRTIVEDDLGDDHLDLAPADM